jgi:hypothetical protein
MTKGKYTNGEVIGALKQLEAGGGTRRTWGGRWGVSLVYLQPAKLASTRKRCASRGGEVAQLLSNARRSLPGPLAASSPLRGSPPHDAALREGTNVV